LDDGQGYRSTPRYDAECDSDQNDGDEGCALEWKHRLDAVEEPNVLRVRLIKENAVGGGCGDISFYEAGDDRQFAAKTAKKYDRSVYEEFASFHLVYKRAGKKHPNLVRARGIATISQTGRPALILDKIDGPDGEALRDGLRTCWDKGYISHAEYWGAIQFIGRRLFSVADYLAKAGVVHCDIKLQNFVVDEKTGEPIVVDLGNAAEKGKPAVGTEQYCAPEQEFGLGTVDDRTDVFSVGTTVFALAEGERYGQMRNARRRFRSPKTGLVLNRLTKQGKGKRVYVAGKPVRRPGTATVDTAYTRSLSDTMARRKADRPSAMEATMSEFFDDPLTDDATALDTLRRVAAFTRTGNWRYRGFQPAVERQLPDATLPRPALATSTKAAIHRMAENHAMRAADKRKQAEKSGD
jgi:serine/threonine protein kinase